MTPPLKSAPLPKDNQIDALLRNLAFNSMSGEFEDIESLITEAKAAIRSLLAEARKEAWNEGWNRCNETVAPVTRPTIGGKSDA